MTNGSSGSRAGSSYQIAAVHQGYALGKCPPETEAEIVRLRQNHPALDAVKLHKIMLNAGYTDLPRLRMFSYIFQRHELIGQEESLATTPYQHFEKTMPNKMWQADFKGYFLMENGYLCHPLNICDNGAPWTPLRALVTLTHGACRSYLTRQAAPSSSPEKRECLKGKTFAESDQAQKRFDEYRTFCNEVRSHFALELDVSVKHYTASTR